MVLDTWLLFKNTFLIGYWILVIGYFFYRPLAIKKTPGTIFIVPGATKGWKKIIVAAQ